MRNHSPSLVAWVLRAERLRLLEAIAAAPGASTDKIAGSMLPGRAGSARRHRYRLIVGELAHRDLIWLSERPGRWPTASITQRGRNTLAKALHFSRRRAIEQA